MTTDPTSYLEASEIIDFNSANVAELAAQLAGATTESTVARCFEFVRDEIQHSADFRRNPVTCAASEVLKHGTGYCYAKSHLLCALLRANQIPAGLCYQRLSIDGTGGSFCLHGLNAVFLPRAGWHRIDPRGNRDDIDARFAPPDEYLAFRPSLAGECDLGEIFAAPLQVVTDALQKHDRWDELLHDLPDWPGDSEIT